MGNPVYERLMQAQEEFIHAGVALAGASAKLRNAIDEAEKTGMWSADLRKLRADVDAQLELVNESIAKLRPVLAEAEPGSLG